MSKEYKSEENQEGLKAPFPYFGGKRRVAHIVWERFGDVNNYVEPFFGSGAVLLGRPHAPKLETVNDIDCFISNFWRALQHDPEGVAYYADSPVNEADLQARHLWLVASGQARIETIKTDPDFYDAKVAGWWVWGLSCWIGSGWCTGDGRTVDGGVRHKRPHLVSGRGVVPSPQKPHLTRGGQGINQYRNRDESSLYDYMNALATRLRRVRVCCGEWWRVTKPSVVEHNGICGIFLDPPYDGTNRENNLYRSDDGSISAEVRKWAIENGNNNRLRIALCGYEGEHEMPDDWDIYAWKANGGYGKYGEGRAKENAKKERIWFSPHCLKVDLPLFQAL